MVRATPAHKSNTAAQFAIYAAFGYPAPRIGDNYPSNRDGFLSPVVYVGDDGLIMTSCDFHRAAQRMEREGGGFEQKLAALYFHADLGNQRKLRDAFLAEFIHRHQRNVEDARNSH